MKQVFILTLLLISNILTISSCYSTRHQAIKGDFLASNTRQDLTQNLRSPLPAQKGFVNDFAGVLDEETKARLEETLTDFKNLEKIDFVFVTVDTTGSQSIFDYSLAVARDWEVGAKNPDKAGLLMLIAIDDKKWHIQITRVLEKVLSNAEVAQLGSIMNAPLKERKYGEGITICVDAFIKTLSKRRGLPS